MSFRMLAWAAALIALGATGGAGCGGCDHGGFDAGLPDRPIVGGGFSLAWSVQDQTTSATVSCDKLDPNASVFVEAKGPSGSVESFSCKNLMGTSTMQLTPGVYIFSYELHLGSIAIPADNNQPGVVIRPGETTALPPTSFKVNANGRLELMLHSGPSGNCLGGAGITGFSISLEHAGGAGDTGCAPVVFNLSGMGDTYNANDCSAPSSTRCIAADETLSVASLPSGPYQIHVRGKKVALDCWINDDALRVPPQGQPLTRTLNLAQSPAAGCQ
jgi:hypothetical protein